MRLAELADRNWPKPTATDFTTQSSALTSARQMARQLLSDSATPPVAEYIYLLSECSVLAHRSVAIRLTEKVEGLKNGGDVIDSLTGKWIERIEGQFFRTTALLKGVATDVWSPEKRKWAHICLHDAILSKKTLDPFEAAALLFHAYIGGEPSRIAHTAILLQNIDSEEAQREVQRQLLWMPFVSLESGQYISADEMTGAILRSLQFQVAITLDSESLPKICERWADEIERIPHIGARKVNRVMMCIQVGFAQSPKVPLKSRLDAIFGIDDWPADLPQQYKDPGKHFFNISSAIDGLPKNGSTVQAILFCARSSVRDIDTLKELVGWLDNVATGDIRQQFDEMLEWPFVQTLGAFVQSAWATGHEETKDWVPWLFLFETIDEYAKRRVSPRFGREAAKAKAIILTEYFERGEEALKVLEQAEAAFGQSTIITEQRANVLFQTKDDESVLELWYQLTSDSVKRTTLDPFTYRRAGISALRLKQWNEAARIFREAADSIQPGTFEVIKFGLQVDAAFAISLGGNQAAAAELLAYAVLSLPAEAADEGNERWEAVQRASVTICRRIENFLWKPKEAGPPFEPGYASSPDLKVPKAEPGQAVRNEMTRVQIFHLASTLLKNSQYLASELNDLAGSKYFSVRWLAIEAQLAQAYSAGSGTGFVETLLAFDKATIDFHENMKQGISLLIPDDGPKTNLPANPERWFGMLCAGMICAKSDLFKHLNIWLDASRRLLGDEAALTKNISLLKKGASMPTEQLQATVIDSTSSQHLRCGAAVQLMLGELSAKETILIQGFLASALVGDESMARQTLFNRHVARCFINSWRRHAQNQFQFYSPRTLVPALLETLDGVEHGSCTLKGVLVAAAYALRQPIEKFVERLL